MEINAINRGEAGLHAPAPVVQVDNTAENRQVVQAVKAVNGTEMFGPENELRFQNDPRTKRMVVRVVNRNTQEVVSQIPAGYLLRLAQDLRKS